MAVNMSDEVYNDMMNKHSATAAAHDDLVYQNGLLKEENKRLAEVVGRQALQLEALASVHALEEEDARAH